MTSRGQYCYGCKFLTSDTCGAGGVVYGCQLAPGLVVFCLWIMERGAGVTNEEIEAWLDWREEWRRRRTGRSHEVPAPKFDPPPPPPEQPLWKEREK